jgi:hypothetical protein
MKIYRKAILPIYIGIMMVAFASAQDNVLPKKWHFRSINNIGFLEGQNGSALQLQTVNGARHKTWFVGIGVGLDYYRYRTIPLFVDFRKEFLSGIDRLFVYADAGIGFTWATDEQKNHFPVENKFSNGFYNDFGMGYKRMIGKNNAFLISVGYSFKKLATTNSQAYPVYLIYPGIYPEDQSQKINYNLNRLSIKMGWEF